jgi:hypothetical protein
MSFKWPNEIHYKRGGCFVADIVFVGGCFATVVFFEPADALSLLSLFGDALSSRSCYLVSVWPLFSCFVLVRPPLASSPTMHPLW